MIHLLNSFLKHGFFCIPILYQFNLAQNIGQSRSRTFLEFVVCLGQPQSMPVDLDPRSASSALSGGGGMPSYYNQLNSVGIDVGSRHQDAGVMTLLFDHSEQLIWQGNSVGHVTSYYGPQLRKYSSFQARFCLLLFSIRKVTRGFFCSKNFFWKIIENIIVVYEIL